MQDTLDRRLVEGPLHTKMQKAISWSDRLKRETFSRAFRDHVTQGDSFSLSYESSPLQFQVWSWARHSGLRISMHGVLRVPDFDGNMPTSCPGTTPARDMPSRCSVKCSLLPVSDVRYRISSLSFVSPSCSQLTDRLISCLFSIEQIYQQ